MKIRTKLISFGHTGWENGYDFALSAVRSVAGGHNSLSYTIYSQMIADEGFWYNVYDLGLSSVIKTADLGKYKKETGQILLMPGVKIVDSLIRTIPFEDFRKIIATEAYRGPTFPEKGVDFIKPWSSDEISQAIKRAVKCYVQDR